jgi:bifunctional N-acetylglucosamine-1-phosphate-uridyltransferase/glucosamine-1-phosphate-acetyltransferase GlmU-like protein
MEVVGFIFARGGSKGLPGKNIRPLCGKPLIAWSIEHALSVKRIARVLVSTDADEIAAVALQNGAEVPFMRPAELAGDNSPEWLAWRHALNYLRETTGELPDVMVSVPTTAPLRFPQDIENCLDEYEKGDADIVITTALIPGKKAPRLVTEDMVKSMRLGSVILDMAVEQGGNCELSELNTTVVKHGVTIIGESNIPSLLPLNASDLYAKNIQTFLLHLSTKDGFKWELEEEITKGSLKVHNGVVMN